MSADGTRHSGACRCGRRAFKYDPGAVRFVLACHCADCRRTTGAAFSTWVGIATSGLRWQGPAPAVHRSAPGVRWGHCPDCGTRLTYDADGDPGEIHVLIGAFTAPEDLPPARHVHWAERLPWIRPDDGLPRHIAGSGSPLVDGDAAAE